MCFVGCMFGYINSGILYSTYNWILFMDFPRENILRKKTKKFLVCDDLRNKPIVKSIHSLVLLTRSFVCRWDGSVLLRMETSKTSSCPRSGRNRFSSSSVT